MTTQPTPLPPSVAELRDVVLNLTLLPEDRRKALDELCRRAADPAPVADEAAIADLLKRIDKATERVVNNHACMRIPVDMSDVDVVLGDCANVIRSLTRRAAPRNDDKLRQLREWGDLWFVHGTPLEGSRGEQAGWSVVREEIDRLLAESPAGEWVEKAHCDTIEGALKETETQLADCRDTVSAQQQTIDSVIVACGSLGLSASELPKHIEGLRARLQAAEADLAAAKSIYHGHWDDCETVAEMMRSACADAVYQREQFKARGGIIDKLEADLAAAKADRSIRDAEADGRRIQDLTAQLAAAQKERDEARSETAYLDNILEGIEHALGDRMKGEHSRAKARHIEALLADLAAAKAEGAKAAVELQEDDVEWVVNDSAELGVRIHGKCFFLYKGTSLVYKDAKHDDGRPMMVRLVGKREFGECCHPWEMIAEGKFRAYDPSNPEDGMHYGITAETISNRELIGKPIPGGGWEPLRAAQPQPAATSDRVAELRAELGRSIDELVEEAKRPVGSSGNSLLDMQPMRDAEGKVEFVISRLCALASAPRALEGRLREVAQSFHDRIVFIGEKYLPAGVWNEFLAFRTALAAEPQGDDDLRRKLAEAETAYRMYREAWIRELGGELIPKMHEIDALVLTTRKMREQLAAARAETAAARAEAGKLAATHLLAVRVGMESTLEHAGGTNVDGKPLTAKTIRNLLKIDIDSINRRIAALESQAEPKPVTDTLRDAAKNCTGEMFGEAAAVKPAADAAEREGDDVRAAQWRTINNRLDDGAGFGQSHAFSDVDYDLRDLRDAVRWLRAALMLIPANGGNHGSL